jgi:hypothetical protein
MEEEGNTLLCGSSYIYVSSWRILSIVCAGQLVDKVGLVIDVVLIGSVAISIMYV